MATNQDTELTLSTGKLLGFFFGMVVVCGIFFSLGYLVGKGSSQAVMPMIDSAANSNISSTGGAKPPAGRINPVPIASQDCTAGDVNCAPPSANSSDASTGAQMTAPKDGRLASAQDAGNAEMTVKPEGKRASSSNSAKTSTPELANSVTGFMVQVAAVSKQEDADALVKALRKKEYPVFVVPQADSKLFHVQVGPFAAQKDAEAMRAKLAGDGYNAILKK